MNLKEVAAMAALRCVPSDARPDYVANEADIAQVIELVALGHAEKLQARIVELEWQVAEFTRLRESLRERGVLK